MSRGPDDLDGHLEVLVRLRRAGAGVYARALQAARVAVAKVVLAEAERRAGCPRRRPTGTVVPFRRAPAAEPKAPKNGGLDP